MSGHRTAPLISLNDKSDMTDTYAFIDISGADRRGAGTGIRFGIGDSDGETGMLEDTSLSEFQTLFVFTSDRSGVGATSTTHGTEAPSAVELDHQAEPAGMNDVLLL